MDSGTSCADAAVDPAPTILELAIGDRGYRIVLPQASTDYIQKKLMAERVPYEHEMLEDMRSRLPPGGLVVDVGANIGNHTLFLAAVAGCHVEAFEPNPALCDALRLSIGLNGLEASVRVHGIGLGRRPSNARFGVDTPHNLGGQHLDLGDGPLKVGTLDDVGIDQRVDMLKIDVEGMELDVLEGARELIGRDRPLIYVECGTEQQFRVVVKWLDALGYDHWETFNATPTHLFQPAERLDIVDRLRRVLSKSAQGDYRTQQLLREVRLRMTRPQAKQLLDDQGRLADGMTKLQLQLGQMRALLDERVRWAQQMDQVQSELAGARTRYAELEQVLLATEQQRVALDSRVRDGEIALHAAVQQHAALECRIAELDRQRVDATKLRAELDAERRSLQAALLARLKLTRVVEVREARIAAAARREQMLREQLALTRESVSFRLGQALLGAGRSWRAALRLPLTLAQLLRQGRGKAHPPPPPPVDRTASAPPTTATPVAHAERKSQPAQRPPEPVAAPSRPPSVKSEFPFARATPSTLPRALHTLRDLRVAAVMDEFTFHAFAPECVLLPLRMQASSSQLADFRPDLVFIESAWKGAEGSWMQKVSNPSSELGELIRWAQAHGVPTVFWNKEDPVHFGTFLHVAKAVDYVFTTDIDCIARYKREVGHERVYLLPFAAQPTAHNPIERFPREDAFCFAGSYYLKYPERQRDFGHLIDTVKELKPVEIFDRNFGRAHPHYEFPAAYQPFIMGSLPFDQIDKAYKGYRYGINMNTIKQSQTMFARRVFELMASNTVVVSNFSRGVRLMFGDLVIASDAPSELRRRLAPLEDDRTLRKFRLAGLRKVMSQHTYGHRLAYIAKQISAGAHVVEPATPPCAVAFPMDEAQARSMVDAFRTQTLQGAALCLVGTNVPPELASDTVFVAPDAAALAAVPAYARAEWIAPLCADDYHGPNYLTDLVHGAGYAGAAGVGKTAHFRLAPGAQTVELVAADQAYRATESLRARSSLLRRGLFESLGIVDAASLKTAVARGSPLQGLDEFNYVLDGSLRPGPAVREAVDDLPGLRLGLDTAAELLPRAERIAPAAHSGAGHDVAAMPGLSAAEIAALLPDNVDAQLADDQLRVRVSLPEGKHRYVYLKRPFARAELNLEKNSRVQLLCSHDDGLEVRTVFEFLDEHQQKISHAINKAGDAVSLPIPAHCQFVRVGLRFVGRGQLQMTRLVLADRRERPTVLVSAAPNLVVLKQYPDYDDIYKYGFVHSRLRAYAREHVACDVFRLAAEEPYACREFENVDVTSGDRDLLDLALQSGQYRSVLVHLMDRSIWEVLKRHLDRVRVTVWVHGAEIQVWQRREFEFERMDAAEVERQKALSDQRVAFWRDVLAQPHPNLRLVFVSKHFAQETMDDLGLDLSSVRHEIIHNFIDSSVFPYVPKTPPDRLRILSIRPFASRKYANDLSAKAILALRSEPWFPDLQVTMVGEGELFDQVTAPLAGLPNVTLSKRFLRQSEIADLHRQHGVFLTPTRMDAQGVSRDEAMSSGLVPITSAVAAVPEFVDDSCGFLAPAEDHLQLAEAIRRLHGDPAGFLALSAAAAARVRRQSGFDQTIVRELALINE